MEAEREQQIVTEIRKYVTDNLPLTQLNDAELEEKIEGIVEQYLKNIYCPIEKRVAIVQQIYSSIRGLGLLDTIMTDDTITEVMINGPSNIFIEIATFENPYKNANTKPISNIVRLSLFGIICNL